MKLATLIRPAALCLAAGLAHAQDFNAAGSSFHFASEAQSRAALAADDDWMATAGPFQRSATLGTKGPVSLPEFKKGLARAGHDCSAAETQRWTAAVAAIGAQLESLRVRLPATVTIVCTDGSDSGGAPYTRADAVFMPTSVRTGRYGDDRELMAHELFHIYSRRNPQLATRLYELVGFAEAGDLEWPREWAQVRLANPDAPHHRHAMRLTGEGGAVFVMPVLVASRTDLKPGETFFRVLQVRLLAVEPAPPGTPSRPVRNNGALVWMPAEESAQYLERLGGNTNYVFHPEETVADNFAYLVSGRTVKNPALLERMRSVLTGESPTPQKVP